MLVISVYNHSFIGSVGYVTQSLPVKARDKMTAGRITLTWGLNFPCTHLTACYLSLSLRRLPGPCREMLRAIARHGYASLRQLPQWADKVATLSYPLLEESPQCYDHCGGAARQHQGTIRSFGRGRPSFPGLSIAHQNPPHLRASDGLVKSVYFIWSHATTLLVALICHCQTAWIIQLRV